MSSAKRGRTRGNKGEDESTEWSRGDWIPVISLGVVVVAWLFFEASYYWISQAMTLLFYAVLIQMWTELAPDEPVLFSRDGRFIEFLWMAVAAVVIGRVIRTGVESFTGEILAIQSLAMSVLIARWYINLKNESKLSLRDLFRYRDPIDQYLVNVPCTVAFFVPAVQYWLSLHLFSFDTTQGFFGLIIASIFTGLLTYGYREEGLNEFSVLVEGILR